MDFNQLVKKIPQPALVIGVLVAALAIFVVSNPLKDECEIKIKIFEKNLHGSLISVRGADKKTKFAQIDYWKENCRMGNSLGACNDYFTGLRKLADELRLVPNKCMLTYIEDNEKFMGQVLDGIKVMALVAWGDAPPVNIQSRLGWLTSADVTTFCRLKTFVEKTHEPEAFKAFRSQVYAEFPDAWPAALSIEERNPELRPKALKSLTNPQGRLEAREVYERSLFSYRCDMYQ